MKAQRPGNSHCGAHRKSKSRPQPARCRLGARFITRAGIEPHQLASPYLRRDVIGVAGQPSIPAIPVLIFVYSFEQFGSGEVRPQGVRDIDLGIGDLP